MPLLLQTDFSTDLLFLLENKPTDIRPVTGRLSFEDCLATKFGYPGEESFHRHPLYESGLDGCNPMRVLNSPWIDGLRRIDSAHPNHHPSVYDSMGHYIFPFQDSTFECVARSFEASKVSGTLLDVARNLLDELAL